MAVEDLDFETWKITNLPGRGIRRGTARVAAFSLAMPQSGVNSLVLNVSGRAVPFSSMAFPVRAAYNAEMRALPGAEIDCWLHDGGLVITASDRAARALRLAFHQRRRAEGLSAWPAPAILDWTSFVRSAWEERAVDGRMLLNSTQEQSLWADIVGNERHLAAILEGPRHRLAAMAMRAHELLCSYAPRYLRETSRIGWDQDAGAFSGWLSAFDKLCRDSSLVSPSRTPLELIPILQADPTSRPSLLAAGFDRLLPIQKNLFDAWGAWQEPAEGAPAIEPHFYKSPDEQTELHACALWCRHQLAADPHARLLVVTQDIASRRGEIERAFLRFDPPGTPPLFEFSLGIPLSQVPLVHSAHLLLRWLDGSLQEKEVDWLLSTGFSTVSPQESAALQAHMRALRRHSLERPEWTLQAFVDQRQNSNALPGAWTQRISMARRHLKNSGGTRQSPLDWAALIPPLLDQVALPGERRLSSDEFQALRRWQQAIDTCGSLGFDGRRISWMDFLASLDRTLEETLFAPESTNAPIQIAGPAESAGLTADAIWFLGADEDTWPPAGSAHPLLPIQIQRESAMPHASPRHDWELAQAITSRLLTAAPLIHFSCAGQKKDGETRPSRLISQLAGTPQPLPSDLIPSILQAPITVRVEDESRVPFSPGAIHSGASVLTAQSQCPFKAFATARLAAQGWRPAEAGLTAAQRGQLLHAVLHAIWDGPPKGFRSLNDLRNLTDLAAFVDGHVQTVLRDKMPAGARDRMPQRYLELEGLRLTRLVTEWLQYEAARFPFTVAETEADRTISLAGLTFKVRLDRIDRLNDGSLLVIDYKSGHVSSKSWQLPRPDDVQLPLYAGFALDRDQVLGGLVFAKIRPGDQEFAGHVGNAGATLFAGLNGNSSLIKAALTAEQLIDWKECIEQLATDFLAGRADVNPRDNPRPCDRCDLQALCRILERQDVLQAQNECDECEELADE